jgi:hypothetical protein
MLKATRDTQFKGWLEVIDFLSDRRPDPVTVRRLSRKLWPHRFAYSKVRPVLMPIRSLLQKTLLRVIGDSEIATPPLFHG